MQEQIVDLRAITTNKPSAPILEIYLGLHIGMLATNATFL